MGDITDWMFESGMLDSPECDDYDGPRAAKPLCRYCGRAIEFVHNGMRWRLYEPGARELHVCQKVPTLNGFEDLT
jgi:hypothetical protein